MKRLISTLLCATMIIGLMLPIHTFAQSDKELEEAIKIATVKLDIPDSFTNFEYNVNVRDNETIWYLNWNDDKQDYDNESISVTINDKGSILNYSHYRYRDYSNRSVLPQLTKEQAREIADTFINKIDSRIFAQLKAVENFQPSIGDMSYNFNYRRVVNGIPFYGNTVSIRVDSDTGSIENYRIDWTEDVDFPAADNVISLEQAQEAYIKNLGLKLIYVYDNQGNEIKIYPVYNPDYDYNEYIDAITGEKINVNDDLYGLRGGAGGGTYDLTAMNEQKAMSELADAGRPLSPEEKKAIEQISNLISQKGAGEIAKHFDVLDLDDTFKLDNAGLYKDWASKEKFIWTLDFNNREDADNKKQDYKYVSVTLNAGTGEIESFYIYDYTEKVKDEKAKYDKSQAQEKVEQFLKKHYNDKFTNTELDESLKDYYIQRDADEKPLNYNFRYIRKINGITFPGNFLEVSYNAVTGKIINFSMMWFDNNVSFPSLDEVLDISKIYDTMFTEVGLELQYIPVYEYGLDKLDLALSSYSKTDEKPNMCLVYAPNPNKPLIFDAYTGVILDSFGKPFEEYKPVEYTDITGHYAENHINLLAQFGIALEGPDFDPDKPIVQKDFLYLISKTLNYYIPVLPMAASKELDNMYKQLIRDGLIKEGERAENQPITREESMKFIIRALKYDKIADLKDIFNYKFDDIENVNPDLIGYIVIGSALGIVKGDGINFNPKDELTRAQAAIVIYNYLQR